MKQLARRHTAGKWWYQEHHRATPWGPLWRWKVGLTPSALSTQYGREALEKEVWKFEMSSKPHITLGAVDLRNMQSLRKKRKQGKKGEGKEETRDGGGGGKERPHPSFIIEGFPWWNRPDPCH